MAAVDASDDPLDLDLAAVVDGDLGDLADDGAEGLVDGDPAPDALAQRLAPVALVGERVEDGEEIGVAIEQPAPVFERIALGRMGALVDEAFDREGVLRGADRAPEHDRHMGVLELDADFQRVGAIGTVDEAFDRLRLDPVLGLAPAERAGDRADRGAEVESVRGAVFAQGGAHLQRRLRPVTIRADILLARPDDFDRPLEGLGDLDRLDQLVIDRAPAEPAAEETIVDVDRARVDPARLGRKRQRRLGRLGAHPDVNAVRAPMRGRVERLHRRMREIGNLVDGFDHFRRVREGRGDVAMAAAVSERAIERGAIFGGELGAHVAHERQLAVDPQAAAVWDLAPGA